VLGVVLQAVFRAARQKAQRSDVELEVEDRLDRERELLERARAGEAAAFGELYDAYAARLYRGVLLPRLGDAQAAEDALGETFRTALERLDRFEFRGISVYHWLARIAHNKAMDMHRARAVTTRRLADLRGWLEPLATVEAADDVFESAVGSRDLARRVELTLAALNPRYRQAIELRFFEECSRERCAELLEIKVATFDVVLLRALRSFRQRWQELSTRSLPEVNDG
jgi:RNA polymerase sigma-70 factor (ECF subfamily)